MDGRRARLVAPLLDRVPALQRAAPEVEQATDERLRPGWAMALGLGWPLVFMVGAALEPAPTGHEAVAPILVEFAGLAFVVALGATIIAAAQRHLVAAPAAVVAGLFAVGFSATCPLSGHHDYGLWWVGQLVLMIAMLGVSLAALGRRSRTVD